jgi:quercetin dioxygenase-like cupin family protein
VRRSLIALPVAAVAAVAATAAAAGGGHEHRAGATIEPLASGGHEHQSGVTIEPLASAEIGGKVRAEGNGIQLRTNGPKATLTARITVEPDGSFGWHSHPGPVLVAVERGTFSLTQVENGRCRTHRFGPGDAFVEDGGRVHLGRNDGGERVRVIATFLARAGTTTFSNPEPTPDACR